MNVVPKNTNTPLLSVHDTIVFQNLVVKVRFSALCGTHKQKRKHPIRKKIIATQDNNGNSDVFDLDEAIAAAVKKRQFLLKRLLGDQGHFTEQ